MHDIDQSFALITGNDMPEPLVSFDGLSSDYAGSGVFAFEREKMLSGDPSAGYIYFDLASPTTIRLGGLLPVDHDGLTAPPASAAGMFLGYSATEYGDPADALRVFEYRGAGGK